MVWPLHAPLDDDATRGSAESTDECTESPNTTANGGDISGHRNGLITCALRKREGSLRNTYDQSSALQQAANDSQCHFASDFWRLRQSRPGEIVGSSEIATSHRPWYDHHTFDPEREQDTSDAGKDLIRLLFVRMSCGSEGPSARLSARGVADAGVGPQDTHRAMQC